MPWSGVRSSCEICETNANFARSGIRVMSNRTFDEVFCCALLTGFCGLLPKQGSHKDPADTLNKCAVGGLLCHLGYERPQMSNCR